MSLTGIQLPYNVTASSVCNNTFIHTSTYRVTMHFSSHEMVYGMPIGRECIYVNLDMVTTERLLIQTFTIEYVL